MSFVDTAISDGQLAQQTNATVTLGKTVVGDCSTTKMIAEYNQFAVLLPLKWLLQGWGPGLRPLAVVGHLQSIKMTIKVSISLLSVCWVGNYMQSVCDNKVINCNK